MLIQESLESLFTSAALQVFTLNDDVEAEQTRLSINFYEHKFLGWWLDLQLHHLDNTHSRVVMRFTLSPEHHSADGGSRHSRGTLSSWKRLPHLSIVQSAGMDPHKPCANRMRAVFKDTNKMTHYFPMSPSAESPYIPILILKCVHPFSHYSWNWKDDLIIFNT